MTDNLPPLPHPVRHDFVGDDTEDLYTADQMREYAAQAVAAERKHVRIPTSAAEAKAMATVAIAWLREHARDELRPEFRA